ncbi:MAG: hypothetical protein AVDCRST_MAG56-1498 [uncultured Cytophagales bacterium]|uniref:Lipoprotein n=1 Tax=uncultured Cytophagales bacterium TaxID=158755 RepID=A0A6J4I5T8_9SPHI|nr:MAG: hypothetical protein AVDCRST_MAG56-1498 [uncultured Cytophagales bacterium]
MKTNIRLMGVALSLAAAALVFSCKKEEAQVQPEADGKVTAAAIIPVGTCVDNPDGSPTDTYLMGANVWTTGNTYIIRGYVRVVPGASLTIQPGVIVRGECEGTLIVERRARIDAQGKPTDPIIFTSNKPGCEKKPGDWGGVIILGSAPNNQGPNVPVEGIYFSGGTSLGYHGGTVPTDNSGIFRFVRIEYAGGELKEGNESNGLTLGSVGSGTVIDHVEVLYSQDDGFEWFGGTVNCTYLYAFGCSDDDFDSDLGYSGRVQWAAGVKPRGVYSEPFPGATNGIESDNDGAGSGAAPKTDPAFANVTLAGPCEVPDPPVFGTGVLVRANADLDLFNAVVLQWSRGTDRTASGPGDVFGTVTVFDGGTVAGDPAGILATPGPGPFRVCPVVCPNPPNLVPFSYIQGGIPAGFGLVPTKYQGAFSANPAENVDWFAADKWLSFPCFGCSDVI